MFLSEAWEKYYIDKKIEGYSLQTLKTYSLQFKMLVRYFGDVNTDEFAVDQLKNYLIAEGEHLKPSSLGHKVHFLRSFFKWLYEEGFISYNPAIKLKEPKVGKRIPKFLTEMEIEQLRDSCITPMEKAVFEFFYSTGCRIGEVVILNRANINISGRSVIVKGKGDKEREVYFNIRCSLWLQKYLEERTDCDESLFVTERRPKKRMGIENVRHIIKRISIRANINKEIHPHQLRHSYATHMLNNGAPIEVIQSLLGHEKSETTKIYAQLSGKLRQDFYSKYF
ncbi:integrase [Halobacillus halophilus]|uniref:Phage integrase domain protein n=1 Tax=Halobacillus halophilus (strain ATCC 35676 / DSM 2266 / JCM 20832 / KCTC 3685 / LMG 17431 / NBRC 102448 / NCIMB 2269) TaxID=866895 RepID=I0JIQ6_HALH3|nr:tyrosine-type recombinase/integrase [Halobacillus halophilus]ASF38203.1 integrase [Halobacillus halophilus]CCG44024.1 phage integrase domain protein [Halobacillus halophilus DSM 2266]